MCLELCDGLAIIILRQVSSDEEAWRIVCQSLLENRNVNLWVLRDGAGKSGIRCSWQRDPKNPKSAIISELSSRFSQKKW